MLAAAFALVVGTIVLSMQFQNRVDQRLAFIRNRGEPANLAELSAWYKEVPAERNAALICTRAFALPCFPGETNETAELCRKEWLPPSGETLKPDQAAEARELLQLAQPALDLLHSVPANAEARYPVDFSGGFSTLLPHVPNFKRAMRLLEVEMLIRSAEGNTRDAVGAIVAADRVQSTLSGEPILVSKLVMLACAEIIVRDIEYLLNTHRLSRDELQSLRAVVRTAGVDAALAQGIAADRAFGLSAFEDPVQFGVIGSGNTAQPNALGRGILETLRVSGAFAGDRAYYLDQMSNYTYAAGQPFPERWQLGLRISQGVAPKKYHVLSRMLLPAFGGAFTREAEAIARLRLAEAALAVEEYRRENSERVPPSLDPLRPLYLMHVPADPFAGHPLRYRAFDEGYTVYSVGPNQKDNGGRPIRKKTRSLGSSAPAGDLCFSVGSVPAAEAPEDEGK